MGDGAPPVRALTELGEAAPLHLDNHLLALAKPAGLLTQAARAGDDNLLDRGRAYLKVRFEKPGNVYLGLVHRLDRNVSGVVLLARTSKAAARLTRAFSERRVLKGYLALVSGETSSEGLLENRLAPRRHGRGVEERPDGKLARTRFRRLGCSAGRSLLALSLETGRKHQARCQLALAGHPIIGDVLYGPPELRELSRPALHAARLELEHPVRREPLRLEAEIPPDLRDALAGFSSVRAVDWSFARRSDRAR